ncbi:MAG: CDP-alcohol phosphatidyltransferase family protein [Proteobacteria bacterium]|nr:CDP-alcohol phosphatidyltransferase family protein [Pseudomonadota bacterium]
MTESDRRPIAARNLQPVQKAADWLVRRQASPNGISVAGMVAAGLGGLCFAATAWPDAPTRLLWLLGAFLVQARLMANLLDGMVAIGRGVASPVGELYNEIPDRVSDTAVLVGVGIAAGQPTLGMAAALAAMATAYIRAVGRSLGLKSDFSGPMAKQQRMAVVTALGVACFLLPAAWIGWGPGVALWVITIGAAATAVRRLLHIAQGLRA